MPRCRLRCSPRSPSPLRLGAAPRPPRRRRPATPPTPSPHALQGRPERPLPARRPVAVPPRQDRVGKREGFQRHASTAGWQPVSVPNTWNVNDNTTRAFRARVGWYRKDFTLPRRRARLAWVVRFESVNYRTRVWLNGKPLGTQPRRLPAVRAPAARGLAQARRRQPARRPRRQPPPPDRLPAVGPDVDRHARPAAGGTTAGSCARSTCARSTRRLQHRSGAAEPALRDVRRERQDPRHAFATTAGARRVASRWRASAGKSLLLGSAAVGARPLRDVRADASASATRGCGRRPTRPLQRLADCARRRQGRAALRPRPGSARSRSSTAGACCSTAAAELPRRRPARGLARRASRSTTRRDQQPVGRQGARRDADPLALPAAPLAPGARGPRWAHAVVGDPGLRDQDQVPQAAARPPARRQRAARQHPDQRQPPVDHRLVDRQRAQLAARARSRATTSSAPRHGGPARPDATCRPRRRRLPGRRLPGRSTSRSTSSASTSTSAGTRARTARSPTARCSRTTSTRSAPAIRTRRS